MYTQKPLSRFTNRKRLLTAARDTSLCESMFGRMVVSRQPLLHKEKIHKRAVCLVEQRKVMGIVVVDDLEGEAVPE